MSRGVFDKRVKTSNKISILIPAGLLIAFLVYCVKSGELANDIAKHGFMSIVAFALLVFLLIPFYLGVEWEKVESKKEDRLFV